MVASDAITELNPDGTLVRVISGPSYRFMAPGGSAFDGRHIWVADATGNSVTVIQGP
jgi:hypothetical protein